MPHTFYIDQIQDPAALLDKAKRLVEENGGAFTGDTTAGSFSAEGVKGAYGLLGDKLTIILNSAPWYATWEIVEAKVREFFNS